jgi:hypothetical protein
MIAFMNSQFYSNLVSPFSHYLFYLTRRPKKHFEKAMLIVSTDIDVGSSRLALLNKGKRDRDVNLDFSEYRIGKVEELSIPIFIKTFDDFGIPMSLAVRGQLTEVDGKVFDAIRASPLMHDIGAHGYYHTMFTELSHEAAEEELQKISEGMSKYSLNPQTFIFPRNRVAHLDLLEKYNYKCYRSRGGLFKDRMQIKKSGNLYDICPSINITENSDPRLLKMILDISIRERVPFHVWFHFWNFGFDEKSISAAIENLFIPFLRYSKEKHEEDLLDYETMLSVAEKCLLNKNFFN